MVWGKLWSLIQTVVEQWKSLIRFLNSTKQGQRKLPLCLETKSLFWVTIYCLETGLETLSNTCGIQPKDQKHQWSEMPQISTAVRSLRMPQASDHSQLSGGVGNFAVDAVQRLHVGNSIPTLLLIKHQRYQRLKDIVFESVEDSKTCAEDVAHGYGKYYAGVNAHDRAHTTTYHALCFLHGMQL